MVEFNETALFICSHRALNTEMSVHNFKQVRLDKSAIGVVALGDDSADVAYWLTKTPQERLAAMEYLRVMNYGYDPVADRLQRVFTVSELGKS